MTHLPTQLGFEGLLEAADTANRAREFERQAGHLPSSMEDGIAYFRRLIRKNHAAMLAGDAHEVARLHEEASLLATRLNGGEPGYLADDDAPGCVLARGTAAETGTVPLWGQEGDFIVTVGSMRVRVELDGMFGIGSGIGFWPGFSAHAVDPDKPFLSETGYRSFLGLHAEHVPGLLPDEFVRKVLGAYIARELKGKPVAIKPEYRKEKGA